MNLFVFLALLIVFNVFMIVLVEALRIKLYEKMARIEEKGALSASYLFLVLMIIILNLSFIILLGLITN